MRGISFATSTEERLIRDMTAQLFPFSGEIPANDSQSKAGQVWKSLVAGGFTGIAIDPRLGGAGMTLLEAMIAAEEGGRNLAPGILAFGAIVGPTVLSMSGASESLTREVVSGSKRISVAPEGALRLHEKDTGRMGGSGTLSFVPDVLGVDLVIARAFGSDGPRLVGLDLNELRAEVKITTTYDPTRQFAKMIVHPESDGIALISDSTDAVTVFDQVGSAVMAADLVGGAARCLEMSISYARKREQFGKKIGSFQAVKHLLVDAHISLELAQSACLWAVQCIIEERPEALASSSTAKALASEAGKRIAETAIQVHGGIGFTEELPLHLFLKRSRVSASLFGDPRHHRGIIRDFLGSGQLPDWLTP